MSLNIAFGSHNSSQKGIGIPDINGDIKTLFIDPCEACHVYEFLNNIRNMDKSEFKQVLDEIKDLTI